MLPENQKIEIEINNKTKFVAALVLFAVIFGFIGPAMVSSTSTILVLLGVVLSVASGWLLYISFMNLFNEVESKMNGTEKNDNDQDA